MREITEVFSQECVPVGATDRKPDRNNSRLRLGKIQASLGKTLYIAPLL
jgi:hypothetical protein